MKHALGKGVDVEDKVWSKMGEKQKKFVDLQKFRKLALAPPEVEAVLHEARLGRARRALSRRSSHVDAALTANEAGRASAGASCHIGPAISKPTCRA